MKQFRTSLPWKWVGLLGIAGILRFGAAQDNSGADLRGVKVALVQPEVGAQVSARLLSPDRLRLQVDRTKESEALAVRVELPISGPNRWPAADVVVRDAHGKALLVQRPGIEWAKLIITLPTEVTTCFVQAVEPPGGWPKSTTDKDREIQDRASGLRLLIARWHDGRPAALSVRFDDSHPSHLTTVVPILRDYGFRGTFMINPGTAEPGGLRLSDFNRDRVKWEALGRQGDQELANHSAHHRGASGDEEMEREIGEAARAIWQLTPGKSKLMALNLGGGTRWETTRTLRYYLDKYHQFDASQNSTGMDDSYGNRVENFRRILEQHIQRGLWCRIHYHSIGEGLSSSEANFRAALEVVKSRSDSLWIAGMADIHKYQTERDSAKLTLIESNKRHLRFQLACQTDPTLYDQPLTVEIVPPLSMHPDRLAIKNVQGNHIATRSGQVDGIAVLRFDVPPRGAVYAIELTP